MTLESSNNPADAAAAAYGADSRTAVIADERAKELLAKVHATHYNTAPEKAVQLRAIRDAMLGSSGHAQERRLLAALQQGPVTTFEAMRLLDVYHAPARVLDLRKRGVNIITTRLRVTTEAGATHVVGQYSLAPGGAGSGQ
jgi:hypothetical protein